MHVTMKAVGGQNEKTRVRLNDVRSEEKEEEGRGAEIKETNYEGTGKTRLN
jgi:hypothetical protein